MRSMRILVALIAGLLLTGSAYAQTSLNSTTLSAAITATQTTFTVASTANITAISSASQGTGLFIPATGELMAVVSIPVSGTVTVRRGIDRTRPWPAANSATVVITQPGSVIDYDPSGPCTGAATPRFRQMINLVTGTVNVCLLAGTWQGRNQVPITQPTTVVLTP